ncbi:MAG: hypothetical protein DBY37_05875 [Desulfovibrionaceae bacterium]|nr:MAG: hypothetical protein DBY37_05875 [Desulfovibrionaceae bacterium]
MTPGANVGISRRAFLRLFRASAGARLFNMCIFYMSIFRTKLTVRPFHQARRNGMTPVPEKIPMMAWSLLHRLQHLLDSRLSSTVMQRGRPFPSGPVSCRMK